ncbi:MAG TPA: GNAT family N-acetyltransferase [Actinomycetes bacterium]
MDIEIRAITPDEVDEVARVFGTTFGERWPAEAVEDVRQELEFDRSLCGFDAGAMVATGGAYTFQLALPGGTQLGAGGLTLISVLPTHRRRGILRALIARHFDDVLGRGEPVSILLASESLLYGRFGYGPATQSAQLAIDRRHAALRPSAVTSGRVRMLGAEEAGRVVPELFERIRRTWPGQVSRAPAWWSLWQRDPEWMRDRWDPRVVVVHEPPGGAPDGYASYRQRGRWTDGVADGVVRVDELFAATPEASAGLWRYLLDLDLTAAIELRDRPVDEPLRWLLVDPRRLRTTLLADFLWLRLLDLPAALAARRYAVPGRLVLEVGDALVPANQGRFLLEGGPDGATCRPAGQAEPDLRLDVAELGAAYLGGVRFASLARAARVAEARPGGLARADAMFAADPAPWCATGF